MSQVGTKHGDFGDEFEAGEEEVADDTGFTDESNVQEDVIAESQRHQSVFPYEDGDFLVVGPQAFMDPSREIFNYRGENYYTAGKAAEVLAAPPSDPKGRWQHLSPEQMARCEALREAREILLTRPTPFSSAVQNHHVDLIEVAEYIMGGADSNAIKLALTRDDNEIDQEALDQVRDLLASVAANLDVLSGNAPAE